MWDTLRAAIGAICRDRSLGLEVTERHRAPAVPCTPWLQEAVREGIMAAGDREAPAPTGLWSRPGHDAAAMAAITGIGMLFIRCRDGISHHPAEHVLPADVAHTLDAFSGVVLAVANRAIG
jgi:allantoate deiminase